MTNEEKTDILVSNYYINESDSPEGAQGVRYGAEMMAEWKDQQFKKYLEKKKEGMVKKWGHLVAAEVSTIDMIINELFGETESDNSDREE